MEDGQVDIQIAGGTCNLMAVIADYPGNRLPYLHAIALQIPKPVICLAAGKGGCNIKNAIGAKKSAFIASVFDRKLLRVFCVQYESLQHSNLLLRRIF